MRDAIMIAVLCLTPAAAFSQEQDLKKAVLHCATADGSSNRLDCYDSLADSLAEGRQPRSPDQWTVKVGKDPLDDTTVVALGLLGTNYQAELVLRCRQAKPEVLLNLRGQLVVGGNNPVVWTRLGVAKAEKKRWSVSADSKAVSLPGDAIPFIRQLLAVDRLTVQIEHYVRGPITDVFDVHRLKDVIAPLSDTCTIR